MKYKLFLILLLFMFSCTKENTVVIVDKDYVPAWIGAGEQSTTEEYNLYIRRIDTTSFTPIFDVPVKIIRTNSKSFDKLSIGDTLQEKY